MAALIAAVGTLPDPQQVCVWLRYFDGLTPRAIAARLGVPVATVHSRLMRAHVRLRASSSDDGRDQRWALALSGALGLPLRPTTIDPTTLGGATLGGAALMTMNKKLLFGLAAGVAFGLVGLRLAVPAVATVPPIEAPAPATLSMGEQPTLANDATRAPLPEIQAPGAPVVPQAFRFTLEMLCLDPSDLPASGTRVLVGVPGHPMNLAGKTDRRGRLRLEWQGREAAMDVLVGEAEGLRLQRLSLTAGWTRTVVLRAQQPMARGVATLLRGSIRGGVFLDLGRGEVRNLRVGFAPTMDRLEGDLRRFVTTARLPVRHTESVELAGAQLSFGLAWQQEPSAATNLRGIVRDAAGRPVADCPIALLGDETGAVRSVSATDAEGCYGLAVPVGPALVRAGGGKHGLAWHRLTVAELDQLNWDPQLDRGYELKGRLVSAGGKALTGWRVEASLEHDTEPFLKSVTTDPEGHFAIPNMPLASCVVRAFHPDCGGIPAHTFLPQMPGTGAVVLEVPAPATELGALALLARTRGQQAVGGTEFVLLADEAGLGTRVRGDTVGAAPALAFPAGSYSVWATAPGRQTRALVTVHPIVEPMPPETTWFDETASLCLRAPRGDDIVVSQLTRAVVFRVEGHDEGGSVAGEGDAVHEQEWSLLPGAYIIDSPTGRRRVELRAGEPQVLDLTKPPGATR